MGNTTSISTDDGGGGGISESVGEGHPDKICAQISDAVLDACLAQDSLSRVAVETEAWSGLIFVFGRLSTRACIDIPQIAREAIGKIRYDRPDQDLDHRACHVMDSVERQPPTCNDVRHELGEQCSSTTEMRPLHDDADQVAAGD